MKHYQYDTKYFDANLFQSDFCIIDNEISNDISADWDYLKGRPIVVGFLLGDKIDIFLAENDHDLDFRDGVLAHITTVLAKTKLYGLNKKMEEGNFKGTWGWTVPVHEIKPFNARGWNKDRFYNELLARKIIPDVKVADVFSGDASLCIDNWAKYQEDGKIEYAIKIVEHNINCLLKESVILQNRQYFLENFKINDRGWLIQ